MADLTSSSWNQEDNLNISSPPNGMPTGSKPSELAPTLRAIMGGTKRAFDHINAMVVSAGTATAFTLTYDVAISAYTKGEIFTFFAHLDNTGALTLNVSGRGARAVVRNDGAALTAGQIKAGQSVMVVYDGTSFRLLSPLFNNPTFTGTLTVPTINSSGQITAGTFSGDGAGVTNVDAATVDGISPASIVQTSRTLTAGNGLTGGGNLSDDRTVTLGTPGTITGSTTNAVTSTSHTHSLTLVNSDITGALGYNPASGARTVSAGNGLTGGGTLSSDPTITMGTPSNITNSSSNSVSGTSHTHALGFTAAEVYTGSAQTQTNLPVGHVVTARTSGGTTRNATANIRLDESDNARYTSTGSGSALTGTWRARGLSTSNDHIFQRTA
ncbi:hypothetical protein AB3G45_19560 [Shinella sp. S4-D37]|uniref:hypothetical protein n=1 Tax=Shinella sp. S4-D37 TaxID=3161999 RepID=UPI003466A422